ncbi:MAG: bifunctional demethylmenaquinone methyltransferase/2-methoxy-6-polyprenyl-1,4-benzoquinol methylase UbiE [SAR202 cluster bacterium]|nr:bifunctional demethylmenaquinone methyltransferase/2-methoxy-6-polyprenyl-1,4-benzoquinol methylase UbiE [SAR202 cluster bacterium]
MAHLRGHERREYVARIFARISRRYDLLNSIMSGGRHHAWRRAAVRMAMEGQAGPALDIATGTGDFAVELARRREVSRVVGLDITLPMLNLARRKVVKKHVAPKADFLRGDAHALPFADGGLACITVGFGVRNFPDLPTALGEMARVLRPGGRLAILEIVHANKEGFLAKLFRRAFRTVTPWLGALLARDREAYTYLPESVREFLIYDELASLMGQAGFQVVQRRSFAFGTVAILVGEKSSP